MYHLRNLNIYLKSTKNMIKAHLKRSILTPSLLVTEHIDTTQSCCLGDAGDFVVQCRALNQHWGSGVRSYGILHNADANNSGK